MRAGPLSLASSKPCVLGCAHFVPEPGQNIRLPLSKKKQAGFEMVVALKVLCQNYMTLCVRIVKSGSENRLQTLGIDLRDL